MEAQATKLTEAELTEIAAMNDLAPALKARGELARRAGISGAESLAVARDSLWWAKFAGYGSVIAVVISVIALFR